MRGFVSEHETSWRPGSPWTEWLTPPLTPDMRIIGIGIDLAEVSRLTRMLRRRPELLSQVFTPREQQLFQARPDRLEHFVAAFAMKEAAFKALGQGWLESDLFWMDIELLSLLEEKLARVELSGNAKRRMEHLGGQSLVASVDCRAGLVLAQLWILA